MACPALAPVSAFDEVDLEIGRLRSAGWTVVRADLADGRVRVRGRAPGGEHADALTGGASAVAAALRAVPHSDGGGNRAA